MMDLNNNLTSQICSDDSVAGTEGRRDTCGVDRPSAIAFTDEDIYFSTYINDTISAIMKIDSKYSTRT